MRRPGGRGPRLRGAGGVGHRPFLEGHPQCPHVNPDLRARWRELVPGLEACTHVRHSGLRYAVPAKVDAVGPYLSMAALGAPWSRSDQGMVSALPPLTPLGLDGAELRLNPRPCRCHSPPVEDHRHGIGLQDHGCQWPRAGIRLLYRRDGTLPEYMTVEEARNCWRRRLRGYRSEQCLTVSRTLHAPTVASRERFRSYRETMTSLVQYRTMGQATVVESLMVALAELTKIPIATLLFSSNGSGSQYCFCS